MLHVAICEDCPDQAETVQYILERYRADCFSDMCVSVFSGGRDLLKRWDRGERYDLLLLDIFMPGMNGIDLARELRGRGCDAPLVFLTSSSDHALEAFSVSAAQYLLKPVDPVELFRVLDTQIAAHMEQEQDSLLISAKNRKVKIFFSSIVCVESIQRVLRVHLTDGSTVDSKTIRVSFNEAMSPLLKDERFLHAHKSFVLNMAHVQELASDSFVMAGGFTVPVPRYKYADAKARFMEFLAGRGVSVIGG